MMGEVALLQNFTLRAIKMLHNLGSSTKSAVKEIFKTTKAFIEKIS